MDVEVDRAGMVRVLGHRALEFRDDLVGVPFASPAAILPVIPWLRIHHRFGMDHGEFDVVRKAPCDFAHRVGPGFVERRPVGGGIGRITGRQSSDERLLLVVCVARQSFAPAQAPQGPAHSPLDPSAR